MTNWGAGYTAAPTCAIATGSGTCSLNLQSAASAPPAGSQVFDISAGDPVGIFNCQSVSGFNMATTNYSSPGSFYWPNTLGPKAAVGTNPNSLTVTYPWTTTANATDTSGYCTLIAQGGPQGVEWVHNTVISDANYVLTGDNEATQGPNFEMNALLQNNIWVGLAGGMGWDSNRGTGCPTEQFNYDISSLTNDHEVWPGQTASKYCLYGNNPNFAVSSPQIYTPATSYCTGATSSASCVGFSGAMSATAMPLTLPDYHSFGLRSDSSFHAGNADAASDGTNMGANIAAIDAAQTQNVYVCTTACGSAGPYSDSLAPSIPASFFGFTENSTSAGNFPTVGYGMQRFWDSPPLQWPSLNTASGVFNFTNLDTLLAQDFTNGITQDMYTLARTPTWASSAPTDTSCNDTGIAPGEGDGECDPPSDLNSDGSGANAIWKAWIGAIATHVNNPTYLTTHAHVRYWEIWNEPDTQAFWAGSIAQLARLTEDANCIITGRGVIHQSGNGSATACAATAIDPSAQIVMSSGHAKTVALTYAQNQLYCSASPVGYQLPCPNPANAIAAAVDIINFHMKPGNESGNNCPAPILCTPESAMQWYVSNIQGMLQPLELAKPLWNGEASYATSGFTNAYTDADMAASFMPRFYLINWSLGISGMAWYTWDELGGEPAEVQTAYQQAYSWLANSFLSVPCAAAGTVWSCGITKSGMQYLILWDTAQSCSGGSCTTGSQTVSSQWTQYRDMTSASAPIAMSGHSVPVGIKPVLLN